MDTRQCARCHNLLEDGWKFCPRCGASRITDKNVEEVQKEHTAAPVRGMILGGVASIGLIVAGVALFFLRGGMYIGFPLILVGAVLPLAMFSIGEQVDKCPYCGTWVMTGADHRRHACPHCNRMFAVDEQQVNERPSMNAA